MSKLRRKIAWEAARLLFHRVETEYFRAKMRAARQLHPGTIEAVDLPENTEIRAEIRRIAREESEERYFERLTELRSYAYQVMLPLRPFQPRLTGPVLTGDLPREPVIELLAYADDTREVIPYLQATNVTFAVDPQPPRSGDPCLQQFLLDGPCPCRLRILPQREARQRRDRRVFAAQATLGELRQILQREAPETLEPAPLDPTLIDDRDRYLHYQSLLMPLETVNQPRQHHPEGDALYHSLQVFELAREELPYDQEWLLAALLHDVGKAVDRRDPLAASLECLQGWVSERTLWFIEHLPAARAIRENKIGQRAHRRLQASPDFDQLMLLDECDRRGRQIGMRVMDVPDALTYLRELAEMCGE